MNLMKNSSNSNGEIRDVNKCVCTFSFFKIIKTHAYGPQVSGEGLVELKPISSNSGRMGEAQTMEETPTAEKTEIFLN